MGTKVSPTNSGAIWPLLPPEHTLKHNSCFQRAVYDGFFPLIINPLFHFMCLHLRMNQRSKNTEMALSAHRWLYDRAPSFYS